MEIWIEISRNDFKRGPPTIIVSNTILGLNNSWQFDVRDIFSGHVHMKSVQTVVCTFFAVIHL